ncbi:MAG: hypothetical protein GY722_04890 [bacterium]|nr:hypothetical protein [bacterium]
MTCRSVFVVGVLLTCSPVLAGHMTESYPRAESVPFQQVDETVALRGHHLLQMHRRDQADPATDPDTSKVHERRRRPFDLPLPTGIAFTPETHGFSIAFSAVTLDPGLGSNLGLGDDDTMEVGFPAGFPFLGTTYSSIFVNSDGNVTMGEGDSASSLRNAVRLASGPPRVAPLLVDLDPSIRGSVHADVRADRLVITWSGVPEWFSSNTNTFQAVLHADGSIDLVYAAIEAAVGVIGVAAGGGEGPVHDLDLTAELPLTLEAGVVFEEFVINEWTSHGPFGGHVSDVAIDPATPSTLYAGGRGGVFKSTDGGESWRRPNVSPVWRTANAIEIDPVNPTTLYVATWNGVFKSTDGGEDWKPKNNGLGSLSIGSLAIDPADPATVFAAVSSFGSFDYGLYKSADGGESWAAVSHELFSGLPTLALAIDPVSPSTLYAVTFFNGVLKSIDGGVSWDTINNGITSDVDVLAIDPVNPAILYAAGDGGDFFKSIDGGANWIAIGNAPAFVIALAIDPVTSTTVYAGTNGGGIFRSIDGGENWIAVNNGLPESRLSTMDVLVVTIDPQSPSTLYAGTFGVPDGVFKSQNGGQSWGAANQGLNATDVRSLAVDPVQSLTLYAGSMRSGMFKSMDGGESWSAANEGLPAVQFRELVTDPVDPANVYAAADRVYRSTDGGQSWTTLDDLPGDRVSALAIDPQNPSTVYVGTSGGGERGLYKSVDSGDSWTHLPLIPGYYRDFDVTALAIDPSNPSIVYAGTEVTSCDEACFLFKTLDGGESWADISLEPNDPEIVALAIDPADPSTLYAGTVNGVLKSLDGGENWTYIFGGSGFFLLRALAVDSFALYAAGCSGLFASTDGGETWNSLANGVPFGCIETLAIDPSNPATLYAGTRLGGVFKMTQACASGEETLCLNSRRFTLELDWKDFEGNPGRGQVVPFGSDDSGLFYYRNPGNWEMLVKVLDGCGINNHFWVFAAATTNVEYTLRVRDTETGAVKEYFNPLGTAAAAITDTSAFDSCPSSTGSTIARVGRLELTQPPSTVLVGELEPAAPLKASSCLSSPSDLCLNGERFRVELDWTDFQGASGSAQVVPFGSDDSGLFYFRNPNNWEMLVKVLDGCAITDHFWVFAAATTNVEYTLRVTDTDTGAVVEYLNPLGNAAAAITDTSAFSACP